MNPIRLFLLGVWQFRRDTHAPAPYPAEVYFYAGRAIAHRLTLNLFR